MERKEGIQSIVFLYKTPSRRKRQILPIFSTGNIRGRLIGNLVFGGVLWNKISVRKLPNGATFSQSGGGAGDLSEDIVEIKVSRFRLSATGIESSKGTASSSRL